MICCSRTSRVRLQREHILQQGYAYQKVVLRVLEDEVNALFLQHDLPERSHVDVRDLPIDLYDSLVLACKDHRALSFDLADLP